MFDDTILMPIPKDTVLTYMANDRSVGRDGNAQIRSLTHSRTRQGESWSYDLGGLLRSVMHPLFVLLGALTVNENGTNEAYDIGGNHHQASRVHDTTAEPTAICCD